MLLFLVTQTSSTFLQQQIQEVFKNQQEQLNMQLLQQKNAGIVSQEVTVIHYSIHFLSVHEYLIIITIFTSVQQGWSIPELGTIVITSNSF